MDEDQALKLLKAGLQNKDGYDAILDIRVALRHLKSAKARDMAAEAIWLAIHGTKNQHKSSRRCHVT